METPEIPKIKNKEEILAAISAAEKRNRARDIEDKQLRAEIAQAEKDFKAIEKEGRESVQEKPGFVEKNWKSLALATGIAIGSASPAGKYVGSKEGSHAEKVATEERVGAKKFTEDKTQEKPIQKAIEPEVDPELLKPTMSEETKASDRARETQIRRELEEKIEKTKVVNVVKDDADIEHNRALPLRLAQRRAEQAAEIARINAGMEKRGVSATAGRVNQYQEPNIDNVSMDTPTKIKAEAPTENSAKISNKMVEEIEEVYENNIEKIFPNDTLKSWRSIKDKGAYELMSKPESKVKKDLKTLWVYLEELKEQTGLKPQSGAVKGRPESIEKYMERALQKAAEMGKLEEVELK
ncbi:MAG: hypothetical protein V4699_01830 [Patescibacteria group bacterium]